MASFVYSGLDKIDCKQELVFDLFINGDYKRTFSNDIQLNEFLKRIWERDNLAEIIIKPVYREYVEL